jgi:hypothetical protein
VRKCILDGAKATEEEKEFIEYEIAKMLKKIRDFLYFIE